MCLLCYVSVRYPGGLNGIEEYMLNSGFNKCSSKGGRPWDMHLPGVTKNLPLRLGRRPWDIYSSSITQNLPWSLDGNSIDSKEIRQ